MSLQSTDMVAEPLQPQHLVSQNIDRILIETVLEKAQDERTQHAAAYKNQPSDHLNKWPRPTEEAITKAASKVKMEVRKKAGQLSRKLDGVRMSLLRASLLVD